MSTPQVAGAAALVREYYQEQKQINPSAALIKATLINGATDISPGQYGTGAWQETYPVPDVSQGWGRMNLKQSLFPDLPCVNEFADESSALSTGGSQEYQYTVVDTSVPLRITLVWTDYPGAVSAATELVNDLDLTVTSPSGMPYSNADHVNNVEQILVPSPEAGTYTVEVAGYNVPMGPQDYALAVSGGLPITYIAGTVTSTSGAGVSGATISVVSSAGVSRVTTSSSGTYVARVGPGTYSVQVADPGWTFTPPARAVQVTNQPVNNVDFSGAGKPGSASGTVASAIGGVTSYVIESSHPYQNDLNQTYTITANPGATTIRVHFAEIDLMNDGDAIYVLDGNNAVLNTYTGQGEDIWSSWATGNVIKVNIVTNATGNSGYGFYVDGYQTNLITQGMVSGATLTLTPGSYQATTDSNGAYSFASVPPGTYTMTPSKPHWEFQPTSAQIAVPANSSTSGVDFTASPPGSINGQVLVTTVQTNNLSGVESPHPYPDNFDQTWVVTADPTATRIRLHFTEIATEPAFDLVYLMDGEGNIVEIYTDHQYDFWSPWITGNVAQIELTSDESVNDWGFQCDQVPGRVRGRRSCGAQVSLPDLGVVGVTDGQGLFNLTNVDAGDHNVVPELPPWSFDPTSSIVSVAPGTAQNLIFYAQASGLLPAQSKLISDGTQVSLSAATVSAAFNGYFYAQDANRTSGVRVVWSQPVSEGSTVDVIGTMVTVDGERRINADSVTAD